ncbi:MAG: hypothetical protein GVY09_02150 [Gammaproteobacteria bacterium]|jgi:hypothetical protein|nr:hypothetical protein [Gammaproteobacteria bacterium]
MKVHYNEGVTRRVEVKGGSGYMEYQFAERLGLRMAGLLSLKRAVVWVRTDRQTIGEQIGFISMPEDMLRLARAQAEAIQ